MGFMNIRFMYTSKKNKEVGMLSGNGDLCIAVLVSTGGSTFRKALEIIRGCGSKAKFIMISDRECEAEKIAYDYNLPLHKIYNKSKTEFSVECKKYLDGFEKIDAVMTFVMRLITDELIDAYPCVNIHPALLPAFKGFNAVDQAYAAKAKFLGATLHAVDREMDHGPIIAQVQSPIPNGASHRDLLNISFTQTVYLNLLLVDLLETKKLRLFPKSKYTIEESLPYDDRCNPLIGNVAYLSKWHEFVDINIIGRK